MMSNYRSVFINIIFYFTKSFYSCVSKIKTPFLEILAKSDTAADGNRKVME